MRSPLLGLSASVLLASGLLAPARLARAEPTPAAGDVIAPLTRAEQAYEGLEYERCAREARAAEAAPGTRADRVRARLLQGLCLAALDDVAGARQAFVRMLMLDREARLPEGLSPRFTSAFLEARGELAGTEPLAITLLERQEEAALQVVRIGIHDPFREVARVGHRSARGGQGPLLKAAPRMELELPVGGDVEIIALDAAGGELASLWLRSKPVAPPAEVAASVRPPEKEGVDALPSWIAWSAGTATLLTGALVVGLWASAPVRVRPVSDVVFGDAP